VKIRNIFIHDTHEEGNCGNYVHHKDVVTTVFRSTLHMRYMIKECTVMLASAGRSHILCM